MFIFPYEENISNRKRWNDTYRNVALYEWAKKARYEGRSEKNYHEDEIEMLGWNMYMTPQQAAHGLALMQNYPEHVEDLGENNGYKDLSKLPVFKECKVL